MRVSCGSSRGTRGARVGIGRARWSNLLIVSHALGATPLVEPPERRLASLRHGGGGRASLFAFAFFPAVRLGRRQAALWSGRTGGYRSRGGHTLERIDHAAHLRFAQPYVPRGRRRLRRRHHQGQPGPDQAPPGLGVRQVAGEEAGEGEPRAIVSRVPPHRSARAGADDVVRRAARDARSIPPSPCARLTMPPARVSRRDPSSVAEACRPPLTVHR